MKVIYFLRHGQTALNKRAVHQYPETRLSEYGREQARHASEYFKDIPLNLIVTSTLTRAKETADIVRTHHPNVPYEQSDLFVELRRPHALWGTNWFSPRSLYVMGLLYLLAGKEGWHYSDEENLEEFHARGRRALEYLADKPEEHILAVTHRGFMANLASRMKHDGMDTTAQYRRALWKNLEIGNGCYMKAVWTPDEENGDTLDGTWTVEDKIICPAQEY